MIFAPLVHRPRLVEEVPEGLRDVVAQHVAVGRQLGAGIEAQAGIVADGAGSVDGGRYRLAGAIRCAVGPRACEGGHRAEGGIGGSVGVGAQAVAPHGDLGGLEPAILLVAGLLFARHHLGHQQAGGNEPLAGAVAVGIVDLHARFVEVLHEARACWAAGIWL